MGRGAVWLAVRYDLGEGHPLVGAGCLIST
jgi:hypothetical protein